MHSGGPARIEEGVTAMFGLGPHELLLLFLIVLLLFGAKRIPEIARGLGRSLRDFRKGLDGVDDDHPAPPPDGTPGATTAAPPANRAGTTDPAPLPGPDNDRRRQ
jgi:sec-independent protein translocase protein TatA